MIVVDASAVLELLLLTPTGLRIAERVLDPSASVHAPELLDVEVTQVLRRFERTGELTAARGFEALLDLADLAVERYPHRPFLPRIWQLRPNLTAYDACYVALAEALDAPLLTCDVRIAGAVHAATIELFE